MTVIGLQKALLAFLLMNTVLLNYVISALKNVLVVRAVQI